MNTTLVCAGMYLFLSLFKLGKRYVELLVHVIFSVELHRSLKDTTRQAHVVVRLLKASILYPVLHLGMDIDKCVVVKDCTEGIKQ